MKILYIANIRLPTEKAHGIQIMQTIQALARIKETEIKLLVPWRFNTIKKSPFEYYDIEKKFNIIHLPVLDLMPLPFLKPLWFWIENVTFVISAIIYTIFQKDTVYYTRDFLTALSLSLFGKSIFYEMHTMPACKRFFHVFVWKRSAGLVAISSGIKKELMRFGISEKKVLIAPDAVDISHFNIAVSKEDARRALNLPLDKKIILYTGHLYAWKGADTLVSAAKKLDTDVLVYLVGGTEEEVSKFKIQNIKYKNIIFVGHKPHQEIPYWLKAADMLVLPTSGKEKIGREYTSPMKLFEYMASGTPIIASDTPAVREILDETTALFFEADNSSDLAEKIYSGISHYVSLDTMSKKAQKVAERYSWIARAEKIFGFIKNIFYVKKDVLRNSLRDVSKKHPEVFAFTKADFWRTLIVGEAIAILSIPVFQNIKVFELLARYNHGLLSLAVGLWLLGLPFAVVLGLYGSYRLSWRWKSSMFQIGKYGLIGLLNTFLSAGILNLFIWITNIARGWQVVVFTVIASVVTITHSFFWNKFWTFQAHNTNNGKAEYVKFFTVTGTTSLLNIFLLHIMVNIIGAPSGIDPKIWVNIAIAIEIPIAFLGNFFGYKMFVFRRHQ